MIYLLSCDRMPHIFYKGNSVEEVRERFFETSDQTYEDFVKYNQFRPDFEERKALWVAKQGRVWVWDLELEAHIKEHLRIVEMSPETFYQFALNLSQQEFVFRDFYGF